MNFFRKLFTKAPPEPKSLWDELKAAGGCLACDGKPKSFLEGPSGGMSTNVFCPHCGEGYNLTPIIPLAERIGKNKSYILR